MTPKELKAARRKVDEVRSAPPAPSWMSAQLAGLLLDKIEEAIGVIAELKANVLAERNRAAKAEMELAECKKLAIATLCDGDQGHEGPGGTLERVIALAKECHDLNDQAGQANAAFRDLCLAAEAKDAQAVEIILDAKWRGPDQPGKDKS